MNPNRVFSFLLGVTSGIAVTMVVEWGAHVWDQYKLHKHVDDLRNKYIMIRGEEPSDAEIALFAATYYDKSEIGMGILNFMLRNKSDNNVEDVANKNGTNNTSNTSNNVEITQE